MAVTEKTSTPEINLFVNQGATFTRTLGWGADPVVQKLITAITQAAPPVLSVASHGLPTGWPFWVEDVQGMRQINNPFGAGDTPDNEPYVGNAVDSGNISIPGLSSIAFGKYTGGGAIRYFTPQDLSGYTARMQLRKPKSSATVILELTEASGISLDNTAKTITVQMTALQTAAFTLTEMEYDLKLTSGSGVVTRIAQGRVTVSPQVTR